MRSHRSTRQVGRSAAFGLAAITLFGCSGPMPPDGTPTPPPPRELTITVVDRTKDLPLVNAALSVGGMTATTTADGTAVLTAVPGEEVRASAAGFDPGSGEVPRDGGLTIALRPNVVSGVVTDGDGRPIAGARVFVEGSGAPVVTDARGRYALPDVPEQGTLIYKMPGHRLGVLPIDAQMTKAVTLPAFEARALYAPSGIF